MVLGTLPMAFAADETAGEMLQAAGFVAGDENGNLMEDNGITRAELAVLVAELNGVKENAKTYAIAPEFSDVTADDWFGPYVAYAAKEGWFTGDDEGNFNPAGLVSDQAMATVMLRALGYSPAWETAVSEAKAMGLPVAAADAAGMTRGEAFSTMWGVVNTPKKDSDVALGVELGKIEPAMEEVTELVAVLDASNTKALGNALVNLDFSGSVDAAAAGEVSNYTIVEKADTTKEIAVLSVVVRDGDDVYLETEALTAGKAYTIIVGDSKANFAGIAKDSDKPSLDSVKGKDTGEIEVVFEDALVDKATAEDVANYSLDREGTIVKASANEGLTKVTLTVEGMTSTRSQKLTVENVMSTDGVVMSKEIKTFGPKFDKTAPKIKGDVKASDHNNVEVLVEWDDDHGVDQATAEDVSNYSIDGLEIISAKATYIDEGTQDDYYDKVILTTSEQAKSKKYELKVKYMLDGSTAANATSKVLTEKFTSGSADKDEPEVSTVVERSLTEISVTFTEDNALDVSTALDAGNYEFEDNELEVVDVRFDDIDDNGNSYNADVTGVSGSINKDKKDIKMILTVTEMEEKESYKLLINNIADNFGNVMDKVDKTTVRISTEIEASSQISTIKTTDLEKVVITFDHPVTEVSSEDATNYVIDGGVGAIKKASWSSSDEKTITLTVPELTQGKSYTLTVNNVENFWGYSTENVKKTFIANSDDKDETQPEVDDTSYDEKGELVIEFDEPMRGTELNDTNVLTATNESAASYVIAKNGTDFYKLYLVDKRDDDKTFVYDAYNNARKEATLLAAKTSSSAPVALPDGVELSIDFISSTDKAGNKLDYDAGDETFTTEATSDKFSGTKRDDALEADSLSQENGNTIEITFDRTVTIPGGTEKSTKVYVQAFDKEEEAKKATMDTSKIKDTYEFTYEITGDNDDTIIFTKTENTFPDDSVYLRFDFRNLYTASNRTTSIAAKDVLDRAIYNEIRTLDVENDDDTEPSIENITAIDSETILVEFSEKLKSTGNYKIKYEDKDDDDKVKYFEAITESWDDDDVRTVVKLKLDSGNFKDQDYELMYVTSPRDLAGNKVDDDKDTTSFTGNAVAPATDMIAASVEGPINLKIQNEKEDFSGTVTVKIDGSTAPVVSNTIDTSDAKFLNVVLKPYYSLLSEDKAGTAKTYAFTYAIGAGSDVAGTQVFTGGLEEDKATVVATAAGTAVQAVQLTTNDVNLDSSSYEFFLVTASDNTLPTAKVVSNDLTAFTMTSNVVTATTATSTEAANIYQGPNGDVIIVAGTGTYKLIVTDKDSGAITVITETITIQ